MPRQRKDVLGKQDGKSASNNKIVAKAPKTKVAASSTGTNPSARTSGRNQVQCSAVGPTRAIARVPPNNSSLSANTLTTITGGATTVSSAAPTSSITPSNLNSVITTNRFHLTIPEVRLIRLPIATNLRIGEHLVNRMSDDDVTYLYTVDASPRGRLVQEIDLTQESEVENPGPSTKKIAAKVHKNRKRKIGEDDVTAKRYKNCDALPMCTVCDTHNDSLIGSAGHMLVASCGHLYCESCSRKAGISDCEACGKRINALRKVYF